MTRRTLWVIALALTVGFGVAQLPALGDMSDHGTGVLGFEFVATTARAQDVLAGWGPQGADAARTQLLLDYGYLAGYGLALWLACTALGLPRLALAGAGAAAFDALENAALLVVRAGHVAQPWPALATAFATLKFVAVAAALLGIAAGLARRRRAPG